MVEKTRRLYTINPKAFKKKRSDEVTKFYSTAPTLYVKYINKEAKNGNAKTVIGVKILTISEKKSFLMVKMHKDNFYRCLLFG